VLSLDSPQWSELSHAYGDASDIPALLRQLENHPSSDGREEPWSSLWSALAHQGDVYPASFAAVPHVIACLEAAPAKADYACFQFPAWVEICRAKHGIEVPRELASAYSEALAKLPALAAATAANRDWDENLLSAALSAIAAAKGFTDVAEAALEMNADVARKFLKWHLEQ
jgi:hypothetical protein